MSSDLSMFTGTVFSSGTATGSVPPADDLSYAEAFPPLPTAVSTGNGADTASPSSPTGSAKTQWGKKMSLKSSTTTQVFSVPVEERRYKEIAEQQFGDRGREQAKTCADIMAKTGVSIEMSLAKDQSLTVVVSGKTDAVLKARKMIVQNLQTQTHATLHIPKEHHRFVLGPKGKKLNLLELETATKINIPRPNDQSDVITIQGTRDGIDRAKHEIQLISDEQAKLAFERVPVPKVYHPFISGPDSQTVRELMERTGVKIMVPPHSVDKDEIVVSGEKDGVLEAKKFILAVFDEKKRKTSIVSVEVKKSQHRYVIGPKGSGLTEILAATGVSVEIPPLDNVSETITLRGDPDKLGPALTMVYAKANSIESRVVEAPSWLHRSVIGRQGANVRRINADFPRVHIEFTEEQDQIRLEGPPEDVEHATSMLKDIVNDLTSRMSYVDLNIDAKFHRHIVGRNGANINRLKTEHNVEIHIPSDADSTSVRIEGSQEGVASAKAELLELVDKMENEKSRDLVIEQRLHRLIIGSQGSRIREIREQFPHVSIFIPDYSRRSDVITLRGPRQDVDRCYTYLQKLCHDLVTANVTAEVRVYRKYYRDVVAIVRKVREETETRIEVPPEGADVTVITVSGAKDNVDRARDMLESTQKALGRVTEQTVDIPHSLHATLQSGKGALMRAVRDQCGGVMIRFPSSTSSSDKVLLKGPEDDVQLAKKLLLDLANDTRESRMTAEVRVNPAFHRFLIGRNGASLRELSERTGARVVFPAQSDHDNDCILIIGQQDAINKATAELEAKIKDLENTAEVEMSVEPRYHRHFLARKADVVRQISDDCGDVSIAFPRAGSNSDKVVLKGARQCVDAAKQRILDIVTELESQVTLECIIPSQHHRAVAGAKWCHVNELTQRYNVSINFPDRQTTQQQQSQQPAQHEGGDVEDEMINGDVTMTTTDADRVRKQDIITVTGKQEDCEAVCDALKALVPVTVEVPVAVELHRYIIGSKGRDVRQLMEDHGVQIHVPPADDNVPVLRVTGPVENVAGAKHALLVRVQQLEDDRQQRVLRSFKLEVSVEPRFHPKIIGRRGTVVSKIRQDHDVQVTMPDRDSDRADVIVITGLEQNALAARDDILRIVHDFEELYSESVEIDRRVHSRIIGGRGRGIRRIIEEYSVDIRFPGRDADNPDQVVITGDEDAVLDCKEHLLQLEDELLQDVLDREHFPSSTSSRDADLDQSGSGGGVGQTVAVSGPSEGFTVRGAPWSATAAPDTTSMDDFPDLAQAAGPSSMSPAAQTRGTAAVKWGPRR